MDPSPTSTFRLEMPAKRRHAATADATDSDTSELLPPNFEECSSYLFDQSAAIRSPEGLASPTILHRPG
jgi:hypothetical protein